MESDGERESQVLSISSLLRLLLVHGLAQFVRKEVTSLSLLPMAGKCCTVCAFLLARRFCACLLAASQPALSALSLASCPISLPNCPQLSFARDERQTTQIQCPLLLLS